MKLTPEAYLRRMRASAVYNVAVQTPLDHAPWLSKSVGNAVWLKREDLQPVFSFKLRGAYAAMARLEPEALEKGVITASAGNHAQGVALASKQLGCSAEIVVPTTTPDVKKRSIEALGATLVCHGDTYDDAYAYARSRAIETGKSFVHPYDDPDVIAGQGTIGLELHAQMPAEVKAIFVAVGGGGLSAGVALALKQLRPGIEVWGVEPEDADAMYRSLEAGERVRLDRVGLFADGVAVRQVGEEPFAIAQQYLNGVLRVSNDEICAAVKDVFQDRRVVLEPAGALAIAGLRRYVEANRIANEHLVAIACGANIAFDRIGHIAERATLGERSEAILGVKIPERPGSFRALCQALRNRSVTEFNYRMSDPHEAIVFVGVHLGYGHEREASKLLVDELSHEGFETHDLSDDELAKMHLRHMVGGPSEHATNERLFHFDFPERPGALATFLETLGSGWNISLFHYRNHGSDRGRVLVGIQVPAETGDSFQRFLAELGYDYSEVTDSAAVRLFLSTKAKAGSPS